MRLKLSLLLVTIFVVYVSAADKERASDAFSYPFNNYPYYAESTPSKSNTDGHRQMVTMSFVIPAVNLPTRLTILETMTSTSTLVCTKSVTNQCSVRRRTQRPWNRNNRPGIAIANNNYGAAKTDDIFNFLLEEDNENQFPIFPSNVQRVEATQLPTREGRAADPQLLILASRYYDNQPDSIRESGFRTDNLNPVAALPFNRRFLSGNGQRQQFMQNLLTVTRRTTILEVDVSTSTPICSTLGRIPQCPPEKPLRQCVWD